MSVEKWLLQPHNNLIYYIAPMCLIHVYIGYSIIYIGLCLSVGECISGALYWKTLYALSKEIGFSRPRIMVSGMMAVNDKFKEVLGR